MPDYKCISFNPVVNVDGWDVARDVLIGAREKERLVDPVTGKIWILKYPRRSHQAQLWSELIASYIAGDLLGWDVQYVGIGSCNGRLGNLLAYFLEPAGRKFVGETMILGRNLCEQISPDFYGNGNTRHTLPLLMHVGNSLLEAQHGLPREDFLNYWAKALALDSLISNTDRHSENWAVIIGPRGTRMAPLYDNGTSMGCQIDDDIGLNRAFDDTGLIRASHLERQKRRGRHHVRAGIPGKRGTPIEDICGEFLKIYPEGRRWFEAAEAASIDAVRDLMGTICAEVGPENCNFLSTRRQRHIYAMLKIGLERIRNVVHGSKAR